MQAPRLDGSHTYKTNILFFKCENTLGWGKPELNACCQSFGQGVGYVWRQLAQRGKEVLVDERVLLICYSNVHVCICLGVRVIVNPAVEQSAEVDRKNALERAGKRDNGEGAYNVQLTRDKLYELNDVF